MLSVDGAEMYLQGNEPARRCSMATRDDGGQQRTTRRTEEAEQVEETEASDVQERHEKLSEDVDDILD
jgi:hypothetical protein